MMLQEKLFVPISGLMTDATSRLRACAKGTDCQPSLAKGGPLPNTGNLQ